MTDSRRADSRRFLADHRGEMPFGLQVKTDGSVLPSVLLGRQIRGCFASAVAEEGWRTYLFSHKEDRDEYRANLPRGVHRVDPLEKEAAE